MNISIYTTDYNYNSDDLPKTSYTRTNRFTWSLNLAVKDQDSQSGQPSGWGDEWNKTDVVKG